MNIHSHLHSVTAFAPASCANVAVGYDILGFAVDAIGDYVTLTQRNDQKIVLENIESPDELPRALDKNICSAIIQKICADKNITAGFSINLRKQIALSSGMGGSAASAVATIIAFNKFLTTPLTQQELIHYALYGEEIACGAAHADNVVPCLFGGLTLIRNTKPLEVIALPIPDCFYVIVHPQLRVETKTARAIIPKELPLKEYVQQSANLASFIVALYEKNIVLLQKSLTDILIEPRRASLVTEFYSIKKAALAAGALGVSFSGSGPSIFAFAPCEKSAKNIGESMQQIFSNNNINAEIYINKINQTAARIINSL